MKIIELPSEIKELLSQYEAPQRLERHLALVQTTASFIINRFRNQWPTLALNEKDILFGASTHDIGKCIITDELYKKGKLHEKEGFTLLKQHGYSDMQSRFTITHGDWTVDDLTIEDLIVCLADKVWKGKRVQELEEKITTIISELTKTDFWDVFVKLEMILEEVTIGSDDRITWQGN